MSKLSGKINLLKLKNAAIVSINGKTRTKKCVAIPIEDNHLYVSLDENNKAKGVYVDFIAWENSKPLPSGDTHGLKPSYNKRVRDKMSEEEKKTIPFFGNMKPYEYVTKNTSGTVDAPQVQAEPTNDYDSDLPF